MEKSKKTESEETITQAVVEPVEKQVEDNESTSPELSKSKDTTTEITNKLQRIKRWGMITGLTIAVLLLLSTIAVLGYEYRYKDKVYPGITLENKVMTGKNYVEVESQLRDYEDNLKKTGLQFTYQDTTVTIPVEVEDPESHTTAPLLDIDTNTTAQQIFSTGRSDTTQNNVSTKITALTQGINYPLQYTVDTETIIALLSAEFSKYETPYANAQLSFEDDGTINILPHTNGKTFDWNTVLQSAETQLKQQQAVIVSLQLTDTLAPVSQSEAELFKPEIQTILDLAPLKLTYENKTYEITTETLQTFLALNDTGITLDTEATTKYIEESIATDIDIPVKEGKFTVEVVDDAIQLKQIADGQNGLEINIEKTLATLNTNVLEKHESTIPLTVEVTEPRANPDNLDNLGIKELLGIGQTNFAGSPPNRVANIKTGAEKLNGLLIAPDETFSLIDALAPFDTANGWLAELVIKGDEIKPEIGGGACQFGSTVFRATMNSGLEIVERWNHSLAISYYNYNGKSGVDATIYEGAKDYQFKNDTGYYILMLSRIEGVDFYIDFWGTSDGRKGSFTDPINYARTSPGAAKETVDPNMTPGSRSCTQHAYSGLTAEFDYIIERPNGATDKRTFKSVYRALAEQCKVGPPAEEVKEEPAEETPTQPPADEPAKNTNTNSNKNSNQNKNNNSNKNSNSNKNN